MEELIILASGSKANAYLLRDENSYWLFDIGLSAKKLEQCLKSLNIHPQKIKEIFLTHSHLDHCRGVKVFSNKWNIRTITTKNNEPFFKRKNLLPKNHELIEDYKTYIFQKLKIETFLVPHDVDNVAFIITLNEKQIVLATDFGHINFLTAITLDKLKNCHTLLIESNYDYELLINCPKRPVSIKRRILGRYGHLSNADCLELINEIASKKLKNLIIAHISEEANTPELIKENLQKLLIKKRMQEQTKIFITNQDKIIRVPL